MNYLYSAETNFCCSFNGKDNGDLKLSKTKCFVDKNTGKPDFSREFRLGAEYVCVEKWILYKGYNELKTYDTKEEAEKELKDILEKLASDGKVIYI